MAKKKKAAQTEAELAGAVPQEGPSSRSLAALVALGGVNALWALFLWAQLLVARAGGKAFCGFSDSASCGTLWDGGFASAVHASTKLPVAGWGLLWGLLATALPLLALMRRSEREDTSAVTTAIRLTAVLGLLSVVGLLVVSASSGALCFLCVGTYVMVGAYGAVALLGYKGLGFPDMPKAVQLTAGVLIAGFLLLLYPGMSTPRNAESLSSEALKQARQGQGTQPNDPHAGHGHGAGEPHAAPTGEPPAFGTGPGTGDAARDAELERFVSALPPQVQGMLSSSLGMWHAAPRVEPQPAARSVWGPDDAPVHIVEWTDVLCGHCAQLHQSLEEISEHVPPNSFKVEPRHFPLDRSCNPNVQRDNPAGPVSCVAAGVQICLEGNDKAHELTGKLFEDQRNLTVDRVYEIASAYMPKDELKACVESPATKKKLEDDIEFARRLDPEGTPIVLVNGKLGNGFGAFLYAMIMTGGTGVHPAFANLPPPDMNAHIH